MRRTTWLGSATCALALTLAIGALSVPALAIAAAGDQGVPARPRMHSLLSSRELWATVDVCDPSDQPDTVGVRGSMPGDDHPKDTMYMRFQLQYLEAKTGAWTDLVHGGDSGFIAVGTAKSARQGGTSFQLGAPVTGKPAYTLRGLVTFQWRHDTSILHEATRTTSAGHQGVADADPAGYSAAQCAIA
jgi:hypothetical protein